MGLISLQHDAATDATMADASTERKVEVSVTVLANYLPASSTRCARVIKRMARSHGLLAKASTRAKNASSSKRVAYLRMNEAKGLGVDAGVLNPTRETHEIARETLANALVDQKAAYEAQGTARERSQHALAVGMVAT